MKIPKKAPVLLLDFRDDTLNLLLDGRGDAIRPFPLEYTVLTNPMSMPMRCPADGEKRR
jgi:hypothetical protein